MNNNKISYFMFIRISEDKFIDSLQKKGQIYCNHIKHFRSIEDSGLKGDQNEGKAYLDQVHGSSIIIDEKVVGTAERAQLYFEEKEHSGNIFCLYGVKTSLLDITKKTLQKITIENEFKDFGKSALLITDPYEFITRVKTALKKSLKEFEFYPVNYYDQTTFQGKLSPFYKSNRYNYQNEVRLWIPNVEEEPFEFFIGNIIDISYKIPVSDLDKIFAQVTKNSSSR